jgi:hypothetical protein
MSSLIKILLRHRYFLIVFFITAVLRISLLFLAQTHVHADEAIIGLMAKHIVEGKSLPVFFYGSNYNGGAAFEAYIASFLFSIFSPGVIQLKLVIVTLSLVALCMFYYFVATFWNRKTALISATLFSIWPTLLKWNFQVRGGYGEQFFFMMAIIYLCFLIAHNRNCRWYHYILLGLCTGLSAWCMELIPGIVLPAIVYMALKRRGRFSFAHIGLALFAFIVGYMPSLYYNITHNGANWKYLLFDKLGNDTVPTVTSVFHILNEVLFRELPRFFTPETVLLYTRSVSWTGWVFYIVSMSVFLYTIFIYRKRLGAFFKGNFMRQGAPFGRDKEIVLIMIFLLCFVPYLRVPIRVPGYLLGIVPIIAIFMGIFICLLSKKRSPAVRKFGWVVLVSLYLLGCADAVKFGKRNAIDSVAIDKSGAFTTSYAGENIKSAISYLKSEGIKYIFATPSFQYPIIFESNETIIASSLIFPMNYCVYPPYDTVVFRAIFKRPVFVLEKESPMNRYLDAFAEEEGMKIRSVKETFDLRIVEYFPVNISN